MSPWVESYIGTPWIAGEFECWHFVARVQAERFGLPDLPLVGAGNDGRAARRLLAEHPERDAWRPVDPPQEGNVVLMQKGALPCHVGVWVAPHHILHSIAGSGAILTAADRLSDLGYRIAGIYRRAPDAGPRH